MPGGHLLARLLAWVRQYCGPGYFNAQGRLLPGHVYALCLAAIYLLIYAIGYVAWTPGSTIESWTPAFGYLLILATLTTWILTGLAFYLDRYRIPTLTLIIILSFAVWTVSKSDYHFVVQRAGPSVEPLQTPAQITARRKHPLLTVVAIDGGGIQSSAWSARVLSGVQRSWPRFYQSVRLISAVSGGAVTASHFVSHLHDRPPTSEELEGLNSFSQRRTLHAIVWGATYPDFGRLLLPIPGFARFEKDRGWALEQMWRLGWPEGVPTLNTLRSGITEGWRPSISLNATQVEAGRPFAFATFAVPESWGIASFDTTFPDRDVDITTASRMSATFPYVTPISRAHPDREGPIQGWHFADGGYYDETGSQVALRWLDDALSTQAGPQGTTTVAFLQIRSKAHPTAQPKDRGWLYQVFGPLDVFLSVLEGEQKNRASLEFDLLRRIWQARGVEIRKFEFAFEQTAPLSWQLSRNEIAAITNAWNDRKNRETLADLLELSRSVER